MKTYPFNMRKHAHDLEFRRNRAKNELYTKQMNGTLREGEEERYQKLIDDLGEATLYWQDYKGLVWLPGKLYGLAVESVGWAESMRQG